MISRYCPQQGLLSYVGWAVELFLTEFQSLSKVLHYYHRTYLYCLLYQLLLHLNIIYYYTIFIILYTIYFILYTLHHYKLYLLLLRINKLTLLLSFFVYSCNLLCMQHISKIWILMPVIKVNIINLSLYIINTLINNNIWQIFMKSECPHSKDS